jgi:hypothetical protein
MNTTTGHRQILLYQKCKTSSCSITLPQPTLDNVKEILVKEVLSPFTTLPLPYPAPLILTPLPSSFAEGIERLSKCKQNRQALKDVKCLEVPFNSSIGSRIFCS